MFKKWILKLIYIVLAVGLVAICVNMFLAPHNIAAGGITGLAVILESLLNFNRSLVVLISTAVILVVTLIFLDKETFFNTVIGALLLPLFIGIVPNITLVYDPMLSMAAGSVIFGIAVSILYANKASSGGTAIPPLIFKKYWNLNTSVGLFITDGVIVLLSLIIFSVDAFFYAVFSILITSATMAYIESGVNKKKKVYIISDKNMQIAQEIMHDIQKGVTILPIIGGHSGKERKMLMVTLDLKKYRQLLTIVNRHDKEAFMITDTVSDVHGQGFTYESGTV
ncbi:MAG: YitT family protein [Oscillospiraceae bacterium]|nr:YitT family protein [Oscillospiraceae bacterium]